MQKYVCSVCGYVYNPEVGAPDNGILGGTPWEEVPEEFDCPACGVEKNMFDPA
ncbi:Rubredoxin [Clostridia bacterium]|nr:Rubredoxin [Clostridia bacterium]